MCLPKKVVSWSQRMVVTTSYPMACSHFIKIYDGSFSGSFLILSFLGGLVSESIYKVLKLSAK